LATKSFSRLLDIDPGFKPNNVLAVRLGIPYERYGDERVRGYYQALLDRIAAVPGVEAVGSAKDFPLRGTGELRPLTVPGSAGGDAEKSVRLAALHVSADYFCAMGVPLREGRPFTTADGEDAPPVWIVNEAFAKRYFPNESPVGKVVRMGPVPIQIIGVVGDFRQKSLTEPAEPYAYIHYPQNMRVGMSIAVRTTGDPVRYANAVREAIWSVDRDHPMTTL